MDVEADVLVIAGDAMIAMGAQDADLDAKVDVLDLVKGVGNRAVGAVGARDHVKDAQDVPDAEDLVLVRVHRKEKVRLVPHAIVALAVLVRVLHVHLVEDVLDQVDAEADVLDAILAVMGLVKLLALVIVVDAMDHVKQNVQQDAWDAVDAEALAMGAQDADLDVMARVLEHVMAVVTAVVDNVKMHVLLPAQQRVQVPAKLKHLVP